MKQALSVIVATAGLLSVALPGGTIHAASEPASLDSVVSAIEKQFAKKSSVRFTVKRKGGLPTAGWDMKGSGAYRFRAKGVYAADLTEITTRRDETGRSRGISIGLDFYSQAYVRTKDGEYTYKSPQALGKWRTGRNLAGVIWGEDLINGINPGFLELAASHGATSTDGGTFEGVKTTLHSGTVTVRVLGERQAGMFFENEEWSDGSWSGPIVWKLWVGPDNLPRRFHAILRCTPTWGEGEVETVTMNIIYRGWGSPVRITAPPKRLITFDW